MGELIRDLQNLKCSFSEMNSSSNFVKIRNNTNNNNNNNNSINHRELLLENFSPSTAAIPQEFSLFSTNHLQQQLPMNFVDVNNVQSFFNLSPPVAVSENIKSYGGRKRKRKNDETDMEKPKEVIHVRAKRGQATDSHSLAERVRREKINEKLRYLQDLVPGCYKTMGMAVMLDVIINYVQSLQNQIEFLSMKLSAASMYHDFNMDRDDIETMQGTNAYEVQEMESMGREGNGGPSNYFQHSTWSL